MVDACTIDRRTGEPTDPDTGVITPVYEQVYTGRCRIQSRNTATTSPTSGQQRVDLLTLEVQLPMSVTGLAVSDLVTVTTSVHDPDLPGRVFRVANLMHKTHATARRVQLEERTS